jgi:hypothetical protein
MIVSELFYCLFFLFFASAMLVNTKEMLPKSCNFSLGCWL